MDKITKKYALRVCQNPLTGEKLTRPIVAERSSRTLANVVDFAIQNHYMTGQVENLTGTVKGFFEALQQYCLQGQDVTLANWIRVHGELSGTVGETGTLDAAHNAFKIRVGALSELAVPLDTFTWQRVDDAGVRVTVRNVAAKGGTTVGVIEKSKAIVATGSNLIYNAAYADAITVAYTEEGLEKSLNLVPETSGATALEIAWPAALDDVASGTVLEFKFKLHGGIKDSPVQVVTKRATLA